MPALKAHIGFIQWAIMVLLMGAIISVYVVAVHDATQQRTDSDCIEQAALQAAQRLNSISIDDAVFGRVGLSDSAGASGARTVTSLNRIYATLLLDEELARQIGFTHMQELVRRDFERAHDVELKLRSEISNVENGADGSADKSLRGELLRSVAQTRLPDESLVDLKVSTGYARPALFDSGMPSVDAATASGAVHHRFGAQEEFAVNDALHSRFYQLAPSTKICSPRRLVTGDQSTLPTFVMVEAQFKCTSGPHAGEILKRSRCAVVGGIVDAAPNTVLMISMPQGSPPQFRNLLQLLAPSPGTRGAWQVAAGGEVPGSGKLVADTVLPPASADSQCALQTAFYHWLRSLGPNVNGARLRQMLVSTWHNAERASLDTPPPASTEFANSALTTDTGARTFAFVAQTAAGAAGQDALRAAFAGAAHGSPFPSSALAVQVDANGNCSVAGRKGFDRQLVVDFIEGVNQTNLACIESSNVARTISGRMTTATADIQRESSLAREELRSIDVELSRVDPATDAGHRAGSLQSRQKQLEEQLVALKTKLSEYERVQQRAALVLENSQNIQHVLFEFCHNVNTKLRQGLFYCENPHGFFVGDGLVFVPVAQAAGEADIYGSRDAQANNAASLWLSPSLRILQRTSDDTRVEGVRLAQLPKLLADPAPPPQFILYNCSALLKDGLPSRPLAMNQSPFARSGVKRGQLAYYCQDAVRSSGDPPVGWSLLIRDLVGNRAFGDKPLPLSDRHWCSTAYLDVAACPSLAVEIQLRSPVLMVPDMPVGSYLVNPKTQERVWQLPPTPVSMF